MSDEESPAVDKSIQIGRDAIGNAIISGDGNVVVIQSTRLQAAEEPAPPAAADIGPNPYMGLLAFQETDAARFFGRDVQTARLWERLRDLHLHVSGKRPTRLLPVLGPSGSGKSSLARAGLIAELARRPLPGMRRARVAVLTPGAHPVEALAAVLARIATNDPTPVAKTTEFEAVLKRRDDDGECDGLRRIADALPDIAGAPLIVLVDQFEEIYSLCQDKSKRALFIDNLLLAARDAGGHLSVVITLRTDFLGETQTHEALNAAICEHQVMIPAMNEEELRQAIAKPAEEAGRPLDDATVTLLLNDTRDRDGALPLLQFALTRIWDGLANGVEPAVTYREIGGVGGALAGEAQRIYQSLSDEEKRIAKRVFLGLVQLGEGTRDTRRRAKVKSLIGVADDPKHVERVIQRFSAHDARLITLSADERGGADSAEVTHEALFEHWRQLSDWVEDSRDDVRFQRRLDDVAVNWSDQERPEGALWRPPDLDLLAQFHERAAEDMTPLQMDFFIASRAAESQRLEIKQREERRLRRRTLIATSAAITALVLLGVSVALLVFAINKAVDERMAGQQLQQANDALLAIQSSDRGRLASGLARDGKEIEALVFGVQAVGPLMLDESAPAPAAYRGLFDAVTAANKSIPLRGHTGVVVDASFSTDGARVVTASVDNTVRLWDARTGKEIVVLEGHREIVRSASFSPDGTQVVTASSDDTARVWDARTGKELVVLEGDNGDVWSASFSPDGTQVLTTCEKNGKARLWDAQTGKELVVLEGNIASASFSPDGTQVATGHRFTARLWDAQSGKELALLEGHTGWVRSASFSPDGETVVTASDDHTARLWDARTGMELAVLEGHEGDVRSASFSPDGTRVVTSDDRTARIWDARTGKELVVLEGDNGDVWSASFSPDGTQVLTASSDDTARIWDARTAEEIVVLEGHRGTVRSASFSPDGTRVVTASWDYTARLWDWRAGTELVKLKGHKESVLSASFNPNGTRVVTASKDGTARLWDAQTGVELAVLEGHRARVLCASFSPDGARVVTASLDGARIWDAQTGVELTALEGHRNAVYSASFSADGTRVVTAGDDNTARLWNARTGKELVVLKGHSRSIVSASFSPDGTRVLTASYDETARLWDARIGKELVALEGHRDTVSASFSPDGTRVLTASEDLANLEKTARLWDAQTGKELVVLEGHTAAVSAVSFSRDGARVLTASSDHTARLWDARTGVELAVLKGHTDGVTSASLSPDGARVVTASTDNTARVWDSQTGVELVVLEGHTGSVGPASFSPDGARVLTASEDWTARIWQVDELELLRRACELLGDRVDSEGLRKYCDMCN